VPAFAEVDLGEGREAAEVQQVDQQADLKAVADVVRCWNQARASGLIGSLSTRSAPPARTAG
jgi:hypothetical protein